MNWLKENPFVAGLVGVLAAGCAVLGFLLSGALGNYTTALESYNSSVQELQKLQNKVPFPDAANLQAAEQQRDRFQNELAQLRKQLAELQTPLDPSVTPQQFSDELRAAFNDITRRAEAAKIKLPENFYLGFNDYSAALPSSEAAPILARELNLIVQICSTLLGPNPDNPMIQSLDTFAREKLPIELPQSPAPNERAGANREKAKTSIQKMGLTVGFTTEQAKFRILLNNLLQFPHFLIIRTLSIENSKLEGPQVESAASPEAQPSLNDLFAAPAPGAKKASLNVLLGRESLKVGLQLELLDFQLLPSPAAP